MKGTLSWVFRWARRAGTWDHYLALAAVVSPVQNIFSSPYTISIYVSSSPRNLAGSRAGPPLFECVSPDRTQQCCDTVTIFSGSDFWKVTVPDPTVDKLRFRLRFVPVPAPYVDHKKQIFQKILEKNLAFLHCKLFCKEIFFIFSKFIVKCESKNC
jgi:hypothetical protein